MAARSDFMLSGIRMVDTLGSGIWIPSLALLGLGQLVFARLRLGQPHLPLLLLAAEAVGDRSRRAFDPFRDRARGVRCGFLVPAHVAKDELVQLAGGEAPALRLCVRPFGAFAGALVLTHCWSSLVDGSWTWSGVGSPRAARPQGTSSTRAVGS